MTIETTTAAPQYPQLVVCAGFPKERRERIERGHRPRWQRIGDRAGHLDRHRLAGTDQKVDVPLLHYLVALVEQFEVALDHAAVSAAGAPDVGDGQPEADRVADEHRCGEHPVPDAEHGDRRAAEHAGAAQQAGQHGQPQQAVDNPLPVRGVLGELDVGVDRVEVAAEPGEGDHITFGDGACCAGEHVVRVQGFQILRFHAVPQFVVPGYPPPPCRLSSASRSSPVALRGNDETNSTMRGHLYRAMRPRAKSVSSSPVIGALTTTTAFTRWPHTSSGTPRTAASSTAGCARSAASTSAGELVSAADLTIRCSGPTKEIDPSHSRRPKSLVWCQPSRARCAVKVSRLW